MSITEFVSGMIRALSTSGIGGKTIVYKIQGATLGVTSVAYTSGVTLGTGNPVAIEVFTKANGTGILQSLVLNDLSNVSGAVDVVVFNSNPSATTFTNNVALDIADADLPKIIGIVSSGGYKAFADNASSTASNLGLPINNVDGSLKIWVAFVSRDTKTYVANELSANIGILQD
jgi:hypothetical protein